MWFGACTSSVGTWMQTLAQSWLVYKISKDPFYLGLDAFLGQVPIILLSLVGGVFADRQSRRNLLLVSQFIQMACAFLLASLFYFDVVKVWHILCLSFTVGIAQAFGGPAYQALIPTLVGAEELTNAIALNSIQFNLARVIGPTLGGLALTYLGATWCFGLNGISFLAVILSLLMIHVRFIPAKSSEPILDSMKKGIAFIRGTNGMESLIVLAFCMTLLGIPLLTFLPVFAKDVLHGDANTFSRLLVFSGLGSVCGALIVAGQQKLRRRGRAALLMLVTLGVLIAAFAQSKSTALSYALIFCAGAALIAVFAMISSLVQTIITDDMRGRVMSVYNVAFRGGMPIGALIAGWFVPRVTAPVTLTFAGGLLVLMALYMLLVHRRVASL
jgi:predicted MFS family arabinose efflux permease